jgi:3alpha(or 20beta)-hydroxysteroid dehydrogenase
MPVLGRIPEPGGVANVIVFSAADDSRYLTGAEFIIDSGDGASVLSG